MKVFVRGTGVCVLYASSKKSIHELSYFIDKNILNIFLLNDEVSSYIFPDNITSAYTEEGEEIKVTDKAYTYIVNASLEESIPLIILDDSFSGDTNIFIKQRVEGIFGFIETDEKEICPLNSFSLNDSINEDIIIGFQVGEMEKLIDTSFTNLTSSSATNSCVITNNTNSKLKYLKNVVF